MPIHIVVLYSLPTRRSAAGAAKITDEDTKSSAVKIAKALGQYDTTVDLFPVSEDTVPTISAIKADCIFNLIEWDGPDLGLSLRALELLELLPIAVTGARYHNYDTTADKAKMKKAFDAKKVPTARWQLFRNGTETVRDDFAYPLLTKLTLSHCSMGLTHDAVIHSKEEILPAVQARLAQYGEPVLVEEFIIGREFQVTLLEDKDGVQVFPPAEITFSSHGTEAFLTFESRWVARTDDYRTCDTKLAHLTSAQRQLFEDVSRHTFTSMDFRGYARFDIRMREEQGKDVLYMLEANCNPGLDDSRTYSMTMSAAACGVTFPQFIWEIVQGALRAR